MKRFYTVIAIILLTLLIIFILENLKKVDLHFFSTAMKAPLSIVALIFYIGGALSGGIVYRIVKKSMNKDE